MKHTPPVLGKGWWLHIPVCSVIECCQTVLQVSRLGLLAYYLSSLPSKWIPSATFVDRNWFYMYFKNSIALGLQKKTFLPYYGLKSFQWDSHALLKNNFDYRYMFLLHLLIIFGKEKKHSFFITGMAMSHENDAMFYLM